MQKLDRFWFGLLLGIIGTPIGMVIYYFLQFHGGDFEGFKTLLKEPIILAPMISLGAILNLGIFFLLINRKWYRSGYGVIGATIIYVVIVLILKFHTE